MQPGSAIEGIHLQPAVISKYHQTAALLIGKRLPGGIFGVGVAIFDNFEIREDGFRQDQLEGQPFEKRLHFQQFPRDCG